VAADEAANSKKAEEARQAREKDQQVQALIADIDAKTQHLNEQIMNKDYKGAQQTQGALSADYAQLNDLTGGQNQDLKQSQQQASAPINGANYVAPSTANFPQMFPPTMMPPNFSPRGGLPAGFSSRSGPPLSPSQVAVEARTNAHIVGDVAREKGIDPVTAVATMLTESGGDSHARGDNNSSFGLFQLHRGGELGSMSEEQAYNPHDNAEVALSVFAQHKGQYSDPGELAAASQRPADPAGYARKVDANLEEARKLLAS
jgi:hypothetical protein